MIQFVRSLALADDAAGIAAERLEEVVFHSGVVKLDGVRSQQVELGFLLVGFREEGRWSRIWSGPRSPAQSRRAVPRPSCVWGNTAKLKRLVQMIAGRGQLRTLIGV